MSRREAEERLRHTDVVVEIALGKEHVISLRKDGGNEFLRGRLAVGARNAYHGDGELTAVMTGEKL